jgi:VanZ family protein
MDRFLELYWKRIYSSSFIRCLFILCTLAIIWLCLVPRPDEFLPPLPFPHFDKVVHACMFGGWAFLGMLAGWLPYSNRSGRWGWIWSVAAASSYGFAIEIIQPYFHRGFEWLDFAADTTGAFLAVATIKIIWTFFEKGNRKSETLNP